MDQFVAIIRPHRENFVDTMTSDEEAIMEKHFRYLKEILANGRLILAGPCLTGEFGLIIFEAENWEAARRMIEQDPSVTANVMKAELHPYRVSLLAGKDN
ncbi:MAG: YciI family protein [Sporolactobacillus sp.]